MPSSYSKSILSVAPLFYCCLAFANSPNATDAQDPGLLAQRAELRHIENKGVGYNTGYTTLEMFLAPSPNLWSVTPLLDLRGHVFNDGRFAANAGIGVRKLAGCRVYGLNTYWDYRNTKRSHYNQVGFGFETLGRRWDARLNGYLPVGAKTSSPYDTHTKSTVNFQTFNGNSAILRRNTFTKSKVEYVMKGLDAEVSVHALKNKNIDFSPAIGPYYYQYKNKHAIGGRVRLSATFFQYLSLDLITTYDNRFHTNVQGSIGINIPLGPKFVPCKNTRFSNCKDNYYLCQRMLQDVIRQEIIVVDKLHKKGSYSELLPAINPLTGLPYVFYFVDNTSHSAGTFESPFSTLLAAQTAASPGDIIYVLPGDGTSTNMDQGIILSANQSLLGASTAHVLTTTLGNVEIPPVAASLPILTNTGPVITLSGDNTLVSGFYIENTNGYGIEGNNVQNVNINNNTIIGNNNDGIYLQDVTGFVNIDNNLFTQTTTGSNYATHLVLSNAHCDATFSNNTFYGYGVHMGGIYAQLSGSSSIGTLNVIGNTFLGNQSNSESAINTTLANNSSIGTFNAQNNHSSFFYYGVNATLLDDTLLSNFISTGNNFGNYRNGYVGISFDLENNSAVETIEITDCILSSNGTYGASIYSGSTGSIGSITLANTVLNEGSYGLALEFDGSGSVGDILVSNCSMSGHYSGSGAYLTLGGTGSVASFTVDNCIVQGNTTGQGISINLYNDGSIGNVLISNSNLDSNPNGGFVIAAQLSGSGSIEDMKVSNCSLMHNDNSYAILANCTGSTATITNLTVANCHLDYSYNGGGVQADSSGSSRIKNLTVIDTTITNSQNDVYVNLNNASMDSIFISNIEASNSQGFAFNLNMNNSTVESLGVNGFSAESCVNGIKLVLDPTSVINNCDLSNLAINGSENSNIQCSGGTLTDLKISNSAIANANSAGINLTSTVSSLTVQDCAFGFNNIGIYTTDTTNAVIKNNALKNTNLLGLYMTVNSGSSTYAIDNNTFSGVSNPSAGYAANITASGGSLCLDFAGNQAMPLQDSSFVPYMFTESGGTFNLTVQTTQANNIGTIGTSGIIGAPGSCTQ